ncbi:MAG: agmatine deiminase family protein [Bacteroidales bacterium]
MVFKKLPLLLISVFTLISILPLYSQETLPKGLTGEEKKIYKNYIENYSYGDKFDPPAVPPRAPAEFEEIEALIISWAAYSAELREIVRHAESRVHVYIITNDQAWVSNYLTSEGIPLDNITFLGFDYDSVWSRDFGPQSIYLDGTDELALIDWVYNRPRPNDNMLPYNFANYKGLPLYQMTEDPNRLVHTGGNLIIDGHGTAFSSKLVLSENSSYTEAEIDNIMYEFIGIDNYVKMDELPYDNISHIDMHMKLLDDETLLVAEFPDGVSDGPYIEANLQYLLDNYLTPYGRPYNVVRIPMVPSTTGNYPPDSHYRTFTNALILNDLVLVPQYHDVTLNQQAIAIYEEAMPGYDIVGINMENVIGASGAIHCITREVAAEDPIFIAHAPIREAFNTEEAYNFDAEIKNVAGITDAYTYWSIDGTTYTQQEMTAVNDTYAASMPCQPCNTEVSYYISATNVNAKTISKPFVAPDGTYTFTVTGDDVEFFADNRNITTAQNVEFTYTGCIDDYTSIEWNFGDGAQPATANTAGPHTVSYNTVGNKTISLTINGDNTLTKTDYIIVNPDYLLGDVNDDGEINVQDIVWLVNYILGNPDPNFNEDAADANQDTEINVSDIVAISNLILDGAKSNGTMPSDAEKAYIFIEDEKLKLESDGNLTALQFQIIADNANDINLEALLSDYQFAHSVKENIITVVIYNIQNSSIPDGIIDLLNLENINDYEWGYLIASDYNANNVELLPKNATMISEFDISEVNIEAFPNPNSGDFSVIADVPKDMFVGVELFDITGRKIIEIAPSFYTKGINQIEISNNKSERGFYFLRVNGYNSANNLLFKKTLKIIIEK